jgi:lambda repressor-like predicted transcriptional regulator
MRRITIRDLLLQTDRDKHLETKFALQRAGSSFNQIARELGISHSTVLAVSNRRAVSARVQEAIARKLGVSPASIWPERYTNKEED